MYTRRLNRNKNMNKNKQEHDYKHGKPLIPHHSIILINCGHIVLEWYKWCL